MHCGTSLKMIEEWYQDTIINSDYNNIYDDKEVDLLDQLADQISRDLGQTKENNPERILKREIEEGYQEVSIEDFLKHN